MRNVLAKNSRFSYIKLSFKEEVFQKNSAPKNNVKVLFDGYYKKFYEKRRKVINFLRKKTQKILSFSRNNLFIFYNRTETETGEFVE